MSADVLVCLYSMHTQYMNFLAAPEAMNVDLEQLQS